MPYMRYLVPVALLWQVTNMVRIEGASTSSPSTSITELIEAECPVEILECTSGSDDCLFCLAEVPNTNIMLDDTTTSSCTSSYITMCDILVEMGCNMEDTYVNSLTGCISSTVFPGCDDFESCSASAFPFAPSPIPSPALSSAPSPALSSASSPAPSSATSPASSSALIPSTMASSSPTSKPATTSSGTDDEDDQTSSGTSGRLQSGACFTVTLMFSLAYVASATFES